MAKQPVKGVVKGKKGGTKGLRRMKKNGAMVPRLRDWEVMKLREEGLTYREIAETMTKRKMPMSEDTAHKIVQTILTNMQVNLAETPENVRQMELNRLDKMLGIAQKLASSRGKAFNRLAAMDRVLKITELRGKLIGLERKEAPKVAVGIRIYHGIDDLEGKETDMVIEGNAHEIN